MTRPLTTRSWLALLALATLVGCHKNATVLPATRFALDPSVTSALVGDTVALKVTAVDKTGHSVPSYRGSVTWQSSDTGAQLPTAYQFTPADAGSHTFTLTVKTPGAQTASVTDTALHATGAAQIQVLALSYTDPPAGTGKIRLVKNAASTATLTVLDLVAAVDLSGYAAGLNLPVDPTRISVGADALTPGTALNLGSAPLAAGAALGTVGSLKGILTSGVSQKAAGAGAMTTDSSIPAGQVFYTLKLQAGLNHSAGVIFDGAAPAKGFQAALRNRAGQDVVSAADFAIGRLEVK